MAIDTVSPVTATWDF